MDKLIASSPLIAFMVGLGFLISILKKYGVFDISVKDEKGIDIVSQVQEQVRKNSTEVDHHADKIAILEDARIDLHGRVSALEAIQTERKP